MQLWRPFSGMLTALLLPLPARAAPNREEPPVIPVGSDAYAMWDRWAYQRIGVRAYMRSTFDRTGGNRTADASHFLYQEREDFNVALDVAGPGILYFARYNHWHGSPWHYEVDGRDHIVSETSTADPLNPDPGSVFLPAALFPSPPTWTWPTTKGANLMWVPISFEQSFRMAYSRTYYGTGYFIYHQFVRGARLSRPIHAWDGEAPPDPAIAELLSRAGTDIAPPAGRNGMVEERGTLALPAQGSQVVWANEGFPRMIRAVEISVPIAHALAFSRARLKVTWDGRGEPSVDAPLALFFGTGLLHNNDGREYLVKGLPCVVKYEADRVQLRTYFPMPYFRSARIELDGVETEIPDIRWSVRHAPFTDPPNHVGYFHATYRDHEHPALGRDLELLDTRKTEGGGDWSGSFVGTSFIFTHDNVLATLEGDPRFYFDDSLTPQAQGTGSEEWGGGGDYWGGLNMTLPLAGHPIGVRRAQDVRRPEDKVHSAYRFLLADLMPFGRNARITLEHGGTNESSEHYETVAYWYGIPAASLVKTDELKVGDLDSERTHGYDSPGASKAYELTSRYEWGVDAIERRWPSMPPISGEGREVFPPHTDYGRYTTGTSEFTLKIDPRNLGVMLCRKLDYSMPNQRADVYIAGAEERAPEWKLAGVWYTAGSNSALYSFPKGELDPAQPSVIVSNRRFRDDEFLVPRDLTEGRTSIRVRVTYTPVERPLYPGGRRHTAFRAWSELRYTAYSFVMPEFAP